MNAQAILQLFLAAVQTTRDAVKAYEEGKDTLSETDNKVIHERLVELQKMSADHRTQVDAALSAAAQRG